MIAGYRSKDSPSMEWLHRVRAEHYRKTRGLPLEAWLHPVDAETVARGLRRIGLRARGGHGKKQRVRSHGNHVKIGYTKDAMPRKIVRQRDILGGRPILEGTRISVDLILRMVAGGMTVDEIAAQYRHLTKADIQGALEYAAKRFERARVRV